MQHRKPDIFCLDIINRRVAVVEITVCYDLYINLALQEKINRYSPLVQMFENRGYKAKLIILCFGSLGCVEKSVISGLRHFRTNKEEIKKLTKWCSISNIIGANYIGEIEESI